MHRFAVAFAVCAAAFAALAARTLAADEPCRQGYVVPYAEQCNFEYGSLKKDTSPQRLSAAYAACARAQNVALACLSSPDHNVHVVALSAAYRDVSQQAEIAMFGQQYAIAQALLTEKLQLLDVVKRDAKPGDTSEARERAATKVDLADSHAGACALRAFASADRQRKLAKAKNYGDLASLLARRADDDGACVRLAASTRSRVYIEYARLVALEESGRAAQAAGLGTDANARYQTCIDDAQRAGGEAVAPVKDYLAALRTLCAGRRNGTYSVDEPRPIDADAAGPPANAAAPKK